MASSSNRNRAAPNPNSNNNNLQVQQPQINFSFNTPIKLDRKNYLLWISQVLVSIRGNRLEDFIAGTKKAPGQQFLLAGGDRSGAFFVPVIKSSKRLVDQNDKSMFTANYAYTDSYNPMSYYAQLRGSFRKRRKYRCDWKFWKKRKYVWKS